MRLSALVGAPAGSGVLRNTSCWHGATYEQHGLLELVVPAMSNCPTVLN